MRIGIFLGYGPQTKLAKEGLGRYIGGLIKGFEGSGNEVVIACPYWLRCSVDNLLWEFSVDKKKIGIIDTKSNPPLWMCYEWITKPKAGIRIWDVIYATVRQIIGRIIIKQSKSHTMMGFVVRGVLVGLLLIVLAPIMLIGILLLVIVKVIWKIVALIRKRLVPISSRIDKGAVQLEMFHTMIGEVLDHLVEMINREVRIDVWFVPGIFWPQVGNIHAPVVVNVPDLVTQVLPTQFADVYNADAAIEDCRKTIAAGKFFITYSEVVKEKTLVRGYHKDPSNVSIIHHANNDLSSMLDMRAVADTNDMDADKEFARAQIQHVVPRGTKYIFYASQYRPNKNIINLVKAYEHLVRERFFEYKLVLTVNINKDSELKAYLVEKGLTNDVISAYDVSNQILAALYKCASLVVNPTLYEGGFPFTFGEGMSVGTPSIMSDIPQTREIINEFGIQEILFNPYDIYSIAEKIVFAVNNLDYLRDIEYPLYISLKKRTYVEVANEYIEAFSRFTND